MIGNTGTNGTRNGRSMSGCVRRRMITPMFTRKNANSVPMLTSLTISFSGTTAASVAISDAHADRQLDRRAGARVDLGDAARHQPVARHREEDARLAVEDGQQHARDRDQRAEREQAARPS